jgi:hypothetical protein
MRTGLIMAILLLHATPVAAQTSLQIDWKVENPFRFYRHSSDVELHRQTFLQLDADSRARSPISSVEARLSDEAWWNSEQPWTGGRKLFRWLRDLRAGEDRPIRLRSTAENTWQDYYARLGWAQLVEADNATCWNERNQHHRNCRSDFIVDGGEALVDYTDYVNPVGHVIVAGLTQAETVTGDCEWAVSAGGRFRIAGGTTAGPVRAPCSDAAAVRVVVPYPDGAELSVTSLDDDATGSEEIRVTDLMIVGMGDSFSSGEGNPDIPIRFRDSDFPVGQANVKRADRPPSGTPYNANFGVPWREADAAARWLDRKCHRSVYSYQVRTALQLAIADPHRSVTFLGLACSGAEVWDGLLFDMRGREWVSVEPDARARRYQPQVNALIYEMCARSVGRRRGVEGLTADFDPRDTPWVPDKVTINGRTVANNVDRGSILLHECEAFARPIDLVLLSIGGNDAGFSPWIKDAVISSKPSFGGKFIQYARQFVRAFSEPASPQKSIDDGRFQSLDARFRVLRDVLEKTVIPHVRGGVDGGGWQRVVFTVFPHAIWDEEGKPCPRSVYGREHGTTVSTVFDITRSGKIIRLCRIVEETLVPTIENAARGEASSSDDWTLVSGHRKRFLNHGFCARGDQAKMSESFEMPYARHFVSRPNREWVHFAPSQFRPYASRQRWFRTFNDDYLTINYASGNAFKPGMGRGQNPGGKVSPEVDKAIIASGGAMHPTAEAHALMADYVYCTAESLLRGLTPFSAEAFCNPDSGGAGQSGPLDGGAMPDLCQQ